MPDWLFQIIGMAGTAAGIYAAIKADLAALHVKADMAAKSADQAHQRIDSLLNHHR
jgi:hypothetical protein